MRKIILFLMAAMVTIAFTACGTDTGSAQKSTAKPEQTISAGKKVLVAYFSRADENYGVGNVEKGNTKILAEMIAEKTQADIFEIKVDHAYPKEYKAATEVAKAEKEANARPDIVGSVPDISQYDVIFLGYPIWWSDLPMGVYTFLEKGDFRGKTIIPFCTHEGSGMSGTDRFIAETTKAKVLEGLEMRGTTAQNNHAEAEKSVDGWLAKLDYK